ncbi:predicted protein [Streptomyces lividans TK24]|uniref:Uncharacterized protein n=1 Tax=Streptomyces lividans 1326 TaxID=1200984 RepID=A0A7U9DLT2_STRLI|nr:predicted protein [Streptomyces lividans TK24]EOY45480.1 hypothetical protein SLI_0761 [Streptomyces lividans 1326]
MPPALYLADIPAGRKQSAERHRPVPPRTAPPVPSPQLSSPLLPPLPSRVARSR